MNLSDMVKDVIPVIENAAPLVAKIIGTYPALAVNSLLPLLAKAFNVDADDAEKLIKVIAEKEDAPAKLKAFEDNHKDLLKNLIENFSKLSHAEVCVKFDFKQPD